MHTSIKSKQLKLNYAYDFNQNNLSWVMPTSLIKAILYWVMHTSLIKTT